MNTKITKETIDAIKAIIDEAEAMRSAYFYNPPAYASSRRYYERKHSHDIVEWIDGTDTYTAEYTVQCSCKNVYAHGYYTKNGEKTTLTAIKHSLARVEAALEN